MKYFYNLLILLAIPGCGGNLSETSELSQDQKDGGTATDSALNPGDASPDSGDASPDSKVDAGETSTDQPLPTAQVECTTDKDCTLVNDCCNCMVLNPHEGVPYCGPSTCFADACTSQGLTVSPRCESGQCILGHDCTGPVTADEVLPKCPDGEVASVKNGHYGPCVKATECSQVSSCELCAAAGYACKQQTAWGSAYHCIMIPSTCSKDFSCSCAGSIVCGTDFCSPSGQTNKMSCECTNC